MIDCTAYVYLCLKFKFVCMLIGCEVGYEFVQFMLNKNSPGLFLFGISLIFVINHPLLKYL